MKRLLVTLGLLVSCQAFSTEVTWQIDTFQAYNNFWISIEGDLHPTGRYYNFTGALVGAGGVKVPLSGTCMLDVEVPIECNLRIGRESLVLKLQSDLSGTYFYWGVNVFDDFETGSITLTELN